jgi:predicted ester cyclase
VTRWTGRGTHTGDLLDRAATGKQATVTAITIVRFVDTKIVESWQTWDRRGLLYQRGVLPGPRSATGSPVPY